MVWEHKSDVSALLKLLRIFFHAVSLEKAHDKRMNGFSKKEKCGIITRRG